MKVLIICTGNSCRSQMAEGILRWLDPRLEVFSAGTRPEKQVHPYAVEVMKELGMDISSQTPDHVNQYTGETFDCVITVCDHARETCPVFTGKVGKRIHIGFRDPADARGTAEEILNAYREVRDQILDRFQMLYENEFKSQLV